MLLKDKAIEAYEKKEAFIQAQDEERLGREAEAIRAMIVERFGIEPDSVDGNTAVVDDLVFERDGQALRLQTQCPDCGKPLESERVYDLESLGYAIMVDEYHPGYGECAGSTDEAMGDNGRKSDMLSSTVDYMQSADVLTQSMALRDGPRNGDDQLAIAQVCALLAVANELKRMNDEIDQWRSYQVR